MIYSFQRDLGFQVFKYVSRVTILKRPFFGSLNVHMNRMRKSLQNSLQILPQIFAIWTKYFSFFIKISLNSFSFD